MKICNKITIVGMGLLGGSIGKALVSRKLAREVVGVVRRRKSLTDVLKFHAADKVTLDISEGVANADIVVLAVPIEQMEDLSRTIVKAIRKDTIVTDVGSVKGAIVGRLENIFKKRGHFVGSHPMAGKETSGIAASDKDLLHNAVTIVTPTAATCGSALNVVNVFWHKLGSRVIELSVKDHDRAVAAVSHLPHVIAASLMNSTISLNRPDFDPLRCAGPSFRDMTRVVSSPSEMWSEILISNKREVLCNLDKFIKQLNSAAKMIEKGDKMELKGFFDKARKAKEARMF